MTHGILVPIQHKEGALLACHSNEPAALRVVFDVVVGQQKGRHCVTLEVDRELKAALDDVIRKQTDEHFKGAASYYTEAHHPNTYEIPPNDHHLCGGLQTTRRHVDER